MHVRRFVLAVLSSALLISAVGCSASTTPTPAEGSSGSNNKNDDGKNPDDSEGPGDKQPGTNTEKTPTDPPKPSKKADGAQCKDSADCESDFCVFKSGGTLGMCTKTCDDNIDCNLGSKCVKLGDAPQKACVPE